MSKVTNYEKYASVQNNNEKDNTRLINTQIPDIPVNNQNKPFFVNIDKIFFYIFIPCVILYIFIIYYKRR